MTSNADVVSSITSSMGIKCGQQSNIFSTCFNFSHKLYINSKSWKRDYDRRFELTLSPSIYGNIVTWADTFGNGAAMYDLTTGNIIGLGHAGESPSIQGDKITWWDENSVIVYNISTGKEIKIVNVSTPAIYCDNLVYVRSKSVDGHPVYSQTDQYNSLFLYNLSTHKEVQLTPYQYATYSTSIYGNKLVWGQANQKNSSEWSKTFLYTTYTQKERVTSA
jgi:hypothetical protein